jgi:CRP/FNR family transcriptional regulator, cyclic AMP receptor protein
MLVRQSLGGLQKHPNQSKYSAYVAERKRPQSARAYRTAARHAATLAPRFDPLYLFHCGMEWHRRGDTGAGWELVEAMRSLDKGARAVAAELLSDTENGRLLVRDLRRTRNGLRQITATPEEHFDFKNQANAEAGMNTTPYGLPIVENCRTCTLKKKGWFCALSPDVTRSFSEFSHLTTYPGAAILFVEGQNARGAFVLCSGRVKLFSTSKEGKVLVFKIVEPGEVIGLSAMVSGDTYEVTAETVGPCLVNFVEREGLLRLIERSGELGLRSALAVSRDFQAACRDIHDLILARSSSGKLARLLLSWVSRDLPATEHARIHAPVTHEEMAQRIGASRETVTRLLSDLKKKDLIRLEGSTLIIRNRTALEAMAV